MDYYPNILTDGFNEKECCSKILTATNNFFNSLPSFKSFKNKELKFWVNEKENKLYLLVKESENFNVYTTKVSSTEPKKIEEDLSYHLKSIKNNEQVHLHQVFSFAVDKYKGWTNDELLKAIRDRDGNQKDAFAKRWTELLLDFCDEEESKKHDLWMSERLGVFLEASKDIREIKKYCDTLFSLNHLNDNFSDDFYINKLHPLNNLTSRMLKSNKDLGSLEMFKSVCVENKFKSKNDAFVWNDGDNCLWMNKDNLVIETQCYALYVQFKGEKDFVVSIIDFDYENLKDGIKRLDNKVDILQDCVLEVKNNKAVYSSNNLMWLLHDDIEYMNDALVEHNIVKKTKSKFKK